MQKVCLPKKTMLRKQGFCSRWREITQEELSANILMTLPVHAGFFLVYFYVLWHNLSIIKPEAEK